MNDAASGAGTSGGAGGWVPGTGDSPAVADAQALVDGLRAMSLLWQLRAMDNIWTKWAQLFTTEAPDATGRTQVDPEQLAQLQVFVAGIEQTFQELADVSRRLEPMVGRRADVLQQQSADQLVEGLSETAQVKVRDVLSKNLDLVASTRASLATMDATAASAVANIRAEVDTLAKGGTSEGDYDPTTEAVIGVIATGVGGWVGPLGVVVVEGFAHSETGQSIIETIGGAISDGVHAVLDFFFG